MPRCGRWRYRALLVGRSFSTVLGIAARRRRFNELSLPRCAARGALGGLLLSLVPAAMVAAGLASVNEGLSVWHITAVISGPLTFLERSLSHRFADARPTGRKGDILEEHARDNATIQRLFTSSGEQQEIAVRIAHDEGPCAPRFGP